MKFRHLFALMILTIASAAVMTGCAKEEGAGDAAPAGETADPPPAY